MTQISINCPSSIWYVYKKATNTTKQSNKAIFYLSIETQPNVNNLLIFDTLPVSMWKAYSTAKQNDCFTAFTYSTMPILSNSFRCSPCGSSVSLKKQSMAFIAVYTNKCDISILTLHMVVC